MQKIVMSQFENINSIYASFRKFELEFDAQEWTIFTREHAEIPIFAVALYLLMVFQLPLFLDKKKKPYNLRPAVAIWNGMLSVFSTIGFFRIAPVLIYHVQRYGIRSAICTDPYFWYRIGPAGLWMTLFIYSKIPELLDTLFLVLQRKRVIFLHWFHHTTVLLYCWHAFHHEIAPGIWFACMNYGVHMIMYAYYFAMACRFRKAASLIAPLITVLQITQMVVGSAVTVYSAWVHVSGGQCKVDPANYRLGLAMYLSYFALFCMLFYSKYLCVPPPSANGSGKRLNGSGSSDGVVVGVGAGVKEQLKVPPSVEEDFCTATQKVVRSTDGGGFFHVRSDSSTHIPGAESNETSPTSEKKLR